MYVALFWQSAYFCLFMQFLDIWHFSLWREILKHLFCNVWSYLFILVLYFGSEIHNNNFLGDSDTEMHDICMKRWLWKVGIFAGVESVQHLSWTRCSMVYAQEISILECGERMTGYFGCLDFSHHLILMLIDSFLNDSKEGDICISCCLLPHILTSKYLMFLLVMLRFTLDRTSDWLLLEHVLTWW